MTSHRGANCTLLRLSITPAPPATVVPSVFCFLVSTSPSLASSSEVFLLECAFDAAFFVVVDVVVVVVVVVFLGAGGLAGAFLGATLAGGSFLFTFFVVSFFLVGVDCETTFFVVVLALALVVLLGASFSDSFVFSSD
jgi:hypothetical protein